MGQLKPGNVVKEFQDRLEVADEQVRAGFLMTFAFTFTDAATNTKTIVVKDKIEVLDVLVQKQAGAGGASNTVQVKNNTDAISDAIDSNDADKTLSRAATIDDGFSTINPGGSLSVTNTKSAGNAACRVYVTVLVLG